MDELSYLQKSHIRFTPTLSEILGFTSYQFVFAQSYPTKSAETNMNAYTRIRDAYISQKPDMFSMKQAHKSNITIDAANDMSGFYEVFNDRHIRLGSGHNNRDVADRQPDLTWGMDYIMCYSDIIKGHNMGGMCTPLLRALPVTSLPEFGKTISFSFSNPHYYPLAELSFDRIHLELRDRAGDLIPFLTGSVIALIEIRKRRKRYE